ncbi:MAG: bla regulator protein BlaR1 [Planctomycetota bacterium]|jgi:bla regulator protein BlaR1
MDYLLKSAVLIALFYGFYKLILQRETFFQLNRLYLIIGILTAAIIPFIVIPIYVEFQVPTKQNLIFTEVNSQELIQESINWFQVIKLLYISGILFFSSKFILNFISLSNLIVKNSKVKISNYTFVKTDKSNSPFSFFNYIVYNPLQFKKSELEQIIIHEKIHANQLHSIDILISQIAIVLFWFNPFIWFYKNEIEQNLEFIADDLTQQKTNCEKSYQKLLLKSSLYKNKLALTNNFYNSLIKKRIIMLHKNRSKSTSQWKYLLIFPLITAFIFTFNTKIIAQNSVSDENKEIIIEERVNMLIINKDTKESELKQIIKDFKKDGVTLTIKKIRRNSDGEITQIAIDLKSKTSNATYSMSSDEPIKPINISSNNNGEDISIRNSGVKHHKNDYFFVSKDGEHKIYSSGKGTKHIVVNHDSDEEGEHEYVIESSDNQKPVIIEINQDVHEDGGENSKWITKEHNNSEVRIIRKGKNKGKNVFVTDLDEDVIIYIDGKKSSKKQMDKLDPSDIKMMNVLKGESAIKKHGGNTENGVIKITTKKKIDVKIIYIDGKKSSKKQMNKLNPSDIKMMNVLKGESAIKKYGGKAEDGVIEITTKEK